MSIETLSEQRCFGGVQGFYKHASTATGTDMRFAVYQPPQAREREVPVLYYLAGLTCTEETATIKAGAQRLAAEHGLLLVMPDTSPRGAGIEGEDVDWDFGTGAGFYIDATRAPFTAHYRMETYITQELRELVEGNFPVMDGVRGIFGHSMGGHGALTLALKHRDLYLSVSAFAPICAPTQCPWGEKAFTGYLGDERAAWKAHDACELIRSRPSHHSLLIDQGSEDQFLATQLHPHLLDEACREAGQPCTLRMQSGYDHSYWFIQTFMPDHVAHHAGVLCR